ncbi:MAG: DNA phosphorothioation-associated protein 4 [Microcystaceae cyanobacterium]
MAVYRIRIAKDKADLVKALADFDEGNGPFQTYADVMAFAAVLGANYQQRLSLTAIAKEPSPISLEVFQSRGYDPLIKLLAIVDTQDPKIISSLDAEAEQQRVQLFEEYANGGLQKLQEQLRGSVDYTERLLLILNQERLNLNNNPTEEFDLSRFL